MPPADRELVDRVVFSLLLPAARIAQRYGLPLRALTESSKLAGFHQARGQGLKLREIVDRLGVSMSAAARLSKRLKHNFLRPEIEHELPCRIEFALWPGPLGEARLAQALPDVEPALIVETLEGLAEEGSVERVGGRTVTWRLLRAVDRRVAPDLYARIDGLNSLCGVLADAVYARFFRDEPTAFARSLMLRIRREDVETLERFYEDELWPLLARLDEAAEAHDDTIELGFGLMWAPHERLRRDTPPADPE